MPVPRLQAAAPGDARPRRRRPTSHEVSIPSHATVVDRRLAGGARTGLRVWPCRSDRPVVIAVPRSPCSWLAVQIAIVDCREQCPSSVLDVCHPAWRRFVVSGVAWPLSPMLGAPRFGQLPPRTSPRGAAVLSVCAQRLAIDNVPSTRSVRWACPNTRLASLPKRKTLRRNCKMSAGHQATDTSLVLKTCGRCRMSTANPSP